VFFFDFELLLGKLEAFLFIGECKVFLIKRGLGVRIIVQLKDFSGCVLLRNTLLFIDVELQLFFGGQCIICWIRLQSACVPLRSRHDAGRCRVECGASNKISAGRVCCVHCNAGLSGSVESVKSVLLRGTEAIALQEAIG
jgi:hypothetical protein